jgi:hypothetical protein
LIPLVFHSYSAAVASLINNWFNKEIILVWDVVAVERANPMDAKAMEVAAQVAVTG